MVGSEMDVTSETQARLDGPIEPKPITYLGGPLSGQKRPDRHEERQVITVRGQDEVYWRLKLSVSDGVVTLPFTAMVYQGPLGLEAIPEIIKRHAERQGQMLGENQDDGDGGAAIV